MTGPGNGDSTGPMVVSVSPQDNAVGVTADTAIRIIFSEAMKANPDDKLCNTYIERCQHLKAEPPKGEWNGVWVMTRK